jgi:hypothetical protein
MDKVDGCGFEIVPYTPACRRQWDEFVCCARNGVFLFERDYMDYHADRFPDASLMAFRGGRLLAVLPATIRDSVLSSHAGLTYGGWVLADGHIDGAMLLGLFESWMRYCAGAGVSRIVYKPLPYIYAGRPSQEDLYALWRCGFVQTGVSLSSAIETGSAWKFNMGKRQQLRKGMKYDPVISESSDVGAFWQLLSDCLAERHEASPVHTAEEMELLRSRFPDNIKLFTLSDEEGLQAGVCIYDTGRVAHSQYAATTPRARSRYYLTVLYHYLITGPYAGRRFFDFGTSNEDGGRLLNAGLLNQKFSMGATGVVYPVYEASVKL